MALFSIIIPLYNKEKYILKTLESVLKQTFLDFEIIIINDGSTDNSLSLVKTIKNSRISIFNQENQGVSIARNNGIANSKGQYIALLDADDIWTNDHLLTLKESIDAFPEANLYCNNYKIKRSNTLISTATIKINHDNKPLIIKDYFKASLTNSIVWTSSVCFSKKSLNTIGLFDTKLFTGQDIDLWIRFALKGTLVFNPKTTMIYDNTVNKSLSKTNLNANRYYLLNKYQNEEKEHSSLKQFLDINRYALAIRSKVNSEKKLSKKVRKEIDYSNLNYKQKILLNSPTFLIILMKKIQEFFIRKKIYLSAFK